MFDSVWSEAVGLQLQRLNNGFKQRCVIHMGRFSIRRYLIFMEGTDLIL